MHLSVAILTILEKDRYIPRVGVGWGINNHIADVSRINKLMSEKPDIGCFSKSFNHKLVDMLDWCRKFNYI